MTDKTPASRIDEIEYLREGIAERDAEIERLRKALERTRPHVRNEIVEECARMVEDCFDKEIARAIRALKVGP